MSENLANNITTTLAASMSTGATTITVASSTGFPSVNFRILINGEIMLVTNVSGVTWTVTRAQEGTVAVTGVSSDLVSHILTAGAIDMIRTDMCRSGAYASKPSTGLKTGDLYIPTDSYYDMLRWNGSSWDHFRHGRLLTAPDAGSYTSFNTGNSTYVSTYGGITAFETPYTTNIHSYIKSGTVTAPYTWTIAYIPHYHPANYNTVGICLQENSSGKLWTVGVGWNSGWVLRSYKWNSPTSYSGDYSSSAIPPGILASGLVWLRIQDDNTNKIASWSSNGVTWTVIGSHTRTDFFTADKVGFYHGDSTGNDTGITVLHAAVT